MNSVKITQEQFNKLAKAADQSNNLRERKTEHGMETGVFLNNKLMAKCTPDENGEYHYVMYM